MSKDYRPLAFCYIIKNKVNGKRYVGQSTQTLKSRFASFPYSHNKYIVEDCEKYGKESFIVDIMPCYLDALDNMEKDLIETLDTTNPDKGYNVQSGGSNTNPTEDSYLFLSDEEIQSRLDKIKDNTSNQNKRLKVRIKRRYEINKINFSGLFRGTGYARMAGQYGARHDAGCKAGGMCKSALPDIPASHARCACPSALCLYRFSA